MTFDPHGGFGVRWGPVLACCPIDASASQAEREEARMSSSLRVVMIALLPFGVFLLPPAAAHAQPPAPRCVGFEACTGNTGTVGPGACIGLRGCHFNSGNISKNACRPVVGDDPADALSVCAS